MAEEDVVGEEAGNLEQKEVLCQKIPHLKRTSLHKKKLQLTETLTQSHKKVPPRAKSMRPLHEPVFAMLISYQDIP